MKVSFLDENGARQELGLESSVYKAAHESNMTVPQYINRTYPTRADQYGTTFEQLCASAGLFMHRDKQFGLRPPTVAQILSGKAAAPMTAGTVIHDADPASRILFPAVILEMIESKLQVDRTTAPAVFDQLVAIDDSVAGDKVEQPVIDFTRPEGARMQGISQLALPAAMLTITVSDVSRRIPTVALGMEISDEAQRATTLDLVALAVGRQAAVERASKTDEYIAAFLNGDLDVGQSALSQVRAKTLDSTITAAGTLTQTAWIKYLYRNFKTRVIDWVICDLSAAMSIENRTGKPVVTTDDPNSPRIDALAHIVNPGIRDVKIFLVEDGVIPANTIMGLDSRYAIRRIRNSEAQYQAVEQFVLRRGTALRFDFGEIAYRLFDTAFDVLSLTIPGSGVGFSSASSSVSSSPSASAS